MFRCLFLGSVNSAGLRGDHILYASLGLKLSIFSGAFVLLGCSKVFLLSVQGYGLTGSAGSLSGVL